MAYKTLFSTDFYSETLVIKKKIVINKLSSNFTKIENLGMNGAVSTKVKKTNI